MILSGQEVLKQVRAGRIRVEPFDETRINPVSLDLHLGDTVAVYTDMVSGLPIEGTKNFDGALLSPQPYLGSGAMDSRKPASTSKFTIDPERGWVLRPGIGYLMHTKERVGTEHYVPILDGKSSIGRLFVKIHETAGFGDPGFYGQYTLEVTSVFPLRVYAGMRFCQMRFHTIEGEIRSYAEHKSNYVGTLAEGPVASRAWKMFE